MNSRIYLLLLCFFLTAVLWPGFAYAEDRDNGGQEPEKIAFVKVIMKDGTEVFGNMLGYSKGYVILEVTHGELEIPVNLIKEIEYEPEGDGGKVARWKPISYKYEQGRGVVDDPKTIGGRVKIVKGMGFLFAMVPFDNIDKCSYSLSNFIYYCSKLKIQKQVIAKLERDNTKLKEFNPNTRVARLKIYMAIYFLYKSLGDDDSEQRAQRMQKTIYTMISGPREENLKEAFGEVLKQTKQKLADAKLELK